MGAPIRSFSTAARSGPRPAPETGLTRAGVKVLPSLVVVPISKRKMRQEGGISHPAIAPMADSAGRLPARVVLRSAWGSRAEWFGLMGEADIAGVERPCGAESDQGPKRRG